jgi:beta-galactosidase GanA
MDQQMAEISKHDNIAASSGLYTVLRTTSSATFSDSFAGLQTEVLFQPIIKRIA